jgi:hypothetical protein
MKVVILHIILFISFIQCQEKMKFVPVNDTNLEIELPEGFEVNGSNDFFNRFLKIGIGFVSIPNPNAQIDENPASFERENVIRKIKLNCAIPCSNLYLTKQSYMPGDTTYEYFAYVSDYENFIIVNALTDNQVENPEAEKLLVDAINSLRIKEN